MTTYQQFLQDLFEFSGSDDYAKRVQELEKTGMTTSDAQGYADVEFTRLWEKKHPRVTSGGRFTFQAN